MITRLMCLCLCALLSTAAVNAAAKLEPCTLEKLEVPFFDYESASETLAGTFTGTYWIDQLIGACKEWPRGKAPAPVRNPISTAPVLLISGGLDPVTPPWLADATAKYLPNSRHLLVPNAGHPFAGLAGCADVLIAQFLEQGSAKDLDFSCAEKVQRPPFASN